MVNNKTVTIGTIIVFVIGIVVVFALMPEIARRSSSLKDKQTITNETLVIPHIPGDGRSINVTLNRSLAEPPDVGWERTNCPLTNVIVSNQSNSTLALGTDYYLDAKYGKISFLNTTAVGAGNSTAIGNTCLIDYDFCATGYASSSGARAMAGFIIIASALGLLGFVIYKFMEGSGWLGSGL